MVQLNNLIKTKRIELTNRLGEFLDTLGVIVRYQEEPVIVIKEITSSKVLPKLAKDFTDIEKGLEGTYTRTTATNMGFNMLLYKLKTDLNNISSTYTPIGEYSIPIMEEIKNILGISTVGIDFNSIKNRQERYNSTNLERNFMLNKLNNLLTTKLANFKLNTTPILFLHTLREILAYIRSYRLNITTKSLDLYNNKCCHVDYNYKNISNPSAFNKDLHEEVTTLNAITGDDRFLMLYQKLSNTSNNNPDDTELDVFNTIVQDLPRTLTSIKDNISNLEEFIHNFKPNENNIKSKYAPGLLEVINRYSKLETTKEEFVVSLTNGAVVIHNSTYVELSLLQNLLSELNLLSNFIYIYQYSYGLIVEAVTMGTIIDGKIDVPLGS